jgi:predicted ABC-type ATPase
MSAARMRIFAGPNGSGKTTIFRELLASKQIDLGIYINADDIEIMLKEKGLLDLTSFGITAEESEVREFYMKSNLSALKRPKDKIWENIEVKDNIFRLVTNIDSYITADLAEFLRQKLMLQGVSFTFETVMSHPSKIDFFKDALKNGYRIYFYYIATEDPEININRVQLRVAQDGHDVNSKTIVSRYYRSLSQLKNAIKYTNRAYIFDNSGVKAKFIAEITDGEDIKLNSSASLPAWVAQYLLV